jgi:hypothetical protein
VLTCAAFDTSVSRHLFLNGAERTHMTVKYLLLLLASALLLSLAHTTTARAENLDVIVDPHGQFPTIQRGINRAHELSKANPNNSYRVFVQPGTYNGPFQPTSSIDVVGSSTAGTFINGSDSLVSIAGMSSITVRNFTFQNGARISISGSRSITVENIVFNLAPTAVSVTSSPTTQIINNTFYKSTTAGISTDSELSAITNNIFANNTAAIAPNALSQPTYNDFYSNGSTGTVTNSDPHSIPNASHSDPNPLFQNPGSDFHLKSGSPAIGTGNPSYPNHNVGTTSDMGAYGGVNADTPPPATVTGVTSSLSGSTITVNWNASSDSGTGVISAYRVYYGTISAASSGFTGYNGTGAEEGSSPVLVQGRTTTTATLRNIPTVKSLAPPARTSTVPLDHAIQVSWSAVPEATRYVVYYSTDKNNLTANNKPIAGNSTSATITGLTNLTPYFITVQAFADNEIFVAVTAVVDSNTAPAAGTINESAFSSETTQKIADPVASDLSAPVKEFPEAASPFPNVKKGGCFIATAAYGFYSAPQVQALRVFRDRYLMTNPLGRAFVAWYYKYGPIGARFITEHPWLKVPVRVALFPLVLMALFLIYVPPAAKGALLCALVLATVYWRSQQRRLLVQQGGMR